MRTDVDAVEKALVSQAPFNLEGNASQGYFKVVCSEDQLQAVTFNRHVDTITIDRNGAERLTVTRDWDQEKTRCILRVDDQPLPLWRISQMALYDAFFI